MSPEVAKEIVKAGEEAGWEISLYEEYSGRGMYGTKTYGVVVNRLGVFAAAAAQAAIMSVNPNEIVDGVLGVQTDSLGHDIIVF